jgi:LPS-assembly lipoprotein
MVRFLVSLLLVAILSACGFQLRGTFDIPFKTIYVGITDTSPIAVALKRGIRSNGTTQMVTDPALAEARLELFGESVHTEVLTINSLGQAAEFYLYYHLRFRVTDNKGHTYINPTDLLLKRLVLSNANAVLAENFEIGQLITDMQSDAAQQILRRVSVLKPGVFVVSSTLNPNGTDESAPTVPIMNTPLSPLTAPSQPLE